MRWLAKSVVQNAIVHLPRHEEINYLLQRRVSRRLPMRWELMPKKVAWADRHLGAVRRFGPDRPIDELRRRYGIDYRAPVDGRSTPFEDGAFDAVTSSDTLEHIPWDVPGPVLVELRRLLAADGVVSHLIDMMDHYRYIDPSITVYSFLKFSDRTWSALNSPIEPQNRLRLPDYRALVRRAGFRILTEQVHRPTAENLEHLRSMDLAPRFRDYELDDLGAKAVLMVATPSQEPW